MFGSQKAADEEDSSAGQEVEEEAGTPVHGGMAGAERGAAAAAGGGGEKAAPASADEPLLNMTAPFSINASVGYRGKNKPEDVQAVQAALNKRMRAGLTVDGKCGPGTIEAIKAFQQTIGKFKPDGLVEVGRGTARALAAGGPAGPPPEPLNPVAPPQLGKGTLEKAPDAWRGMHGILGKNVGELKRAVRSEYASEHPTLVKDIEEALKKLDAILQNIGGDLADHLAEANAAKDAAVRKAKLQQCKAMVAKHIMYVKSEPLIAHIDKNPFGVATNFQKIVTDHLVHVAQAIGNVG
jgi:peptidoglycan hydrolase-like protein with peptidoglycan-binding domain